MEMLALLYLFTVDPYPNYPPLQDRCRFPPREIAHDAMKFNRAYRGMVESRIAYGGHNVEYWKETLQETDYLYHCWDWLHAAQGGEGRDEQYWRKSLGEVRDRIGEANYAAGQMPPAAPYWRFVPVK